MFHSDDAPEHPLLKALNEETERRLQTLEGAFVLVCAKGEDLFLVRDPAGIKVIYWTVHQERFLFASEIKALFADPKVNRRIRTGAIPEYLTFSFVPGARTMFGGIEELQPGSLLKYSRGKVSIHRHFTFEDFEWSEEDNRPGEEYAEQVRSALETSVQECCALTPRPPSVFLSGGLDSSAVLAMTTRHFNETRLKTFSVHFGEQYANENAFVAMMVDRYKTDHTSIEVRPSGFLKRLREIIWSLDDPIGDPVTVPNYLLAEAASEVSDVVLNGEGGDPCFGGPKNIPMLLTRLYGPLPTGPAERWLEDNYLLSYRRCYKDLREMLDPAVWVGSGGEEALMDIVSPFFQASKPRSFLNKLMAMNIRLKGANLILVKVDKMTSANGLLALAPLFSKRIIEASMACPPGLKLMGNIEKAVLKQAVRELVPRPILERPKSGMLVPLKFWFKGEMLRYAKRLLAKKNLDRMGIFNTDYVDRLLASDFRRDSNDQQELKLWMLLTFVLWHEQMLETSPSHNI